jgi:hypothetical protein
MPSLLIIPTVLGEVPFAETQYKAESRLEERRDTCRSCSSAGFANFREQNRELQYASVRWPSRSIRRKAKKLSKRQKIVTVKEIAAKRLRFVETENFDLKML